MRRSDDWEMMGSTVPIESSIRYSEKIMRISNNNETYFPARYILYSENVTPEIQKNHLT